MLKFYYHPLSPIARRVWLALLEKEIAFEPVLVNLGEGEQNQPPFLALNPFHHVPVVVDGDLRVLESLAILDYLEARYPSPMLMPRDPAAIARMRMVQLVTANELLPKLPAITLASETAHPDSTLSAQLGTVFDFFTIELGDADYFGGDRLSLADITAGAIVPLLVRFGVSLETHPAIAAWHDRLRARSAWQQTEPDEESFQVWKRRITIMFKRYQRQKL